jgi:K+-transporting ATPase ATPase B chain
MVKEALSAAFSKLSPKQMYHNPVMFTVEIGTVVMFLVSIYSISQPDQGSFVYNAIVFFVLF